MAQSFCMYATARRTVTPVAGEPTTVVASLIELPAGAYVVVGKATVWTIDKNQGQAEFRLRAHPTKPQVSPQPWNEDFSRTTVRVESTRREVQPRAATIALTLGTESSEIVDIDFLYDGGGIPVELEAVKIMAIPVDQLVIQGI
jgi:hypothetical protein